MNDDWRDERASERVELARDEQATGPSPSRLPSTVGDRPPERAVPGSPRFSDTDLARYARLADDAGLPLSIWLARATAAARTGSREEQLSLPLGGGGRAPSIRTADEGAGAVPGVRDEPGARELLDALHVKARETGCELRLTVRTDGETSLGGLGASRELASRELSGGPDLADCLLETLREESDR